MHTARKKKFPVTITPTDRKVVRKCFPGASLEVVDRGAVAHAAARNVFMACKNTSQALDCLTAGIPEATIMTWARERAKRAA